MKLKHLLCVGAAILMPPAAADALVINLVDIGGVSGSPAAAAYEIAARYWESVLTNDVTITIGVGYEYWEQGAIAGTSTAVDYYSVGDWVDGVASTKSDSALDTSVVMPTVTDGGVSMITTGSYVDNVSNTVDPVYNEGTTESSRTIILNTAVVKAIGGTVVYDEDDTDQLDGEVTFNASLAFDYDPSDGISAGTLDFIGVAIHEFGHALGFVSGVDSLDSYYGEELEYDLNEDPVFSALDMFRYSQDATDVAPGDGAVIDGSVGAGSYFSIDGGETALYDGYFASGSIGGDGDQASHWRENFSCDDELGIMDPSSCYGQAHSVKAIDLAAFDAIGWNTTIDVLADADYEMSSAEIYRQFATPVPEPATWAMMLAGFALVGGALRVGRSPRRRLAAI